MNEECSHKLFDSLDSAECPECGAYSLTVPPNIERAEVTTRVYTARGYMTTEQIMEWHKGTEANNDLGK